MSQAAAARSAEEGHRIPGSYINRIMKKAASKEAAKSAIKEVQQSLTELTLTKVDLKQRPARKRSAL
jgi:hypothetical protein